MHEHHKLSVIDKSSTQAASPSPDAPRAIEVWCEICPTTGFAPRRSLIERGWDISKSAFCPVCARSI